ncbi:MAG TPA: CHRD domain-containing protein [Actinomycetota bacterium]|nr:CHRD domain-containing protein [Actinomycetota bacterium]
MGRRALLALLVVATLVAGIASLATAGHGGFHATLDGYEEVPAISTTGEGTFRAEIVSTAKGDVIRYELTYSGLEADATAAHIHFGQPAVAGGVIAWLCGGGGKPACPPRAGTVRGTITPGDIIGPENQGIAPGEFGEAVRAMRAGVTYANVHSSMFPTGEIRGQIGRDFT